MKKIEVKLKKRTAEALLDAICDICSEFSVELDYYIGDSPNSHQARYICVYLDGQKRTSTLPLYNKGCYFSGSSLTKLKTVIAKWFEQKRGVTLNFN